VPLESPVVDTFIVDEPAPVTAEGEKVGFGPVGLEVVLKFTTPENPPVAAIVTV